MTGLKKKDNNLVENYIKTATGSGEPLRVAMDNINGALSTKYQANKLSEWRKTKAVPDPVRVYMMGVVLLPLLRKKDIHVISLEDDEINFIIEGLMPPPKTRETELN